MPGLANSLCTAPSPMMMLPSACCCKPRVQNRATFIGLAKLQHARTPVAASSSTSTHVARPSFFIPQAAPIPRPGAVPSCVSPAESFGYRFQHHAKRWTACCQSEGQRVLPGRFRQPSIRFPARSCWPSKPVPVVTPGAVGFPAANEPAAARYGLLTRSARVVVQEPQAVMAPFHHARPMSINAAGRQ